FKHHSYVYITVYSSKENKLFLFNKDGEEYNGFPMSFYGLPVITDLENDDKPNLIGLSNRKTLRAYILQTNVN
ncbi:MAG: hypothetical protein D6707_11770, partial [Bacteroidetes bacterium]